MDQVFVHQAHGFFVRHLLEQVEDGEMLSYEDVQEILRIPLLGIIPESESVLQASNQGNPAIHIDGSDVSEAYKDVVGRFLGEDRPLRFAEYEKPGFLSRLPGIKRRSPEPAADWDEPDQDALDDGAAEMSDCDFTREVEVALDSAGYLSLYGREGGYCQGAAHPFFAEYGLTFDRKTGAEVDWAKLLPEALLATTDEGGSGSA